MSMQIVLISVLVVGGAGLIIGLLLGVAGKKFAVEVDEREITAAAADIRAVMARRLRS